MLIQGFWYFVRLRSSEIQVNLWNPVKFTKTCKIPWNSVEILSTTCLYNIFWNLCRLLGLFTCRKLANLSWNFITETCKKRPGTTRRGLCCEDLGALSMMLKALPLVHFWSILLFKEQMMASVRKILKTLVWSAQNRSISSKIYPENNHKIGRFLPTTFRQSLPRKLLWNSHEISPFFLEFVFKNPAKFDFFAATYQKPCLSEMLMLHTIFLPFFYIYNSALLSAQPKL